MLNELKNVLPLVIGCSRNDKRIQGRHDIIHKEYKILKRIDKLEHLPHPLRRPILSSKTSGTSGYNQVYCGRVRLRLISRNPETSNSTKQPNYYLTCYEPAKKPNKDTICNTDMSTTKGSNINVTVEVYDKTDYQSNTVKLNKKDASMNTKKVEKDKKVIGKEVKNAKKEKKLKSTKKALNNNVNNNEEPIYQYDNSYDLSNNCNSDYTSKCDFSGISDVSVSRSYDQNTSIDDHAFELELINNNQNINVNDYIDESAASTTDMTASIVDELDELEFHKKSQNLNINNPAVGLDTHNKEQNVGLDIDDLELRNKNQNANIVDNNDDKHRLTTVIHDDGSKLSDPSSVWKIIVFADDIVVLTNDNDRLAYKTISMNTNLYVSYTYLYIHIHQYTNIIII